MYTTNEIHDFLDKNSMAPHNSGHHDHYDGQERRQERQKGI